MCVLTGIVQSSVDLNTCKENNLITCHVLGKSPYGLRTNSTASFKSISDDFKARDEHNWCNVLPSDGLCYSCSDLHYGVALPFLFRSCFFRRKKKKDRQIFSSFHPQQKLKM
ncbi:hypothetical protein GQX74_011256 [Glossina fuscipes]|nr:hypothetical protein GQX74_011256 [Glossina fuscipes]